MSTAHDARRAPPSVPLQVLGKLVTYAAALGGFGTVVLVAELVRPGSMERGAGEPPDQTITDLVVFGEICAWGATSAYTCVSGVQRLCGFRWMYSEREFWSSNVAIGMTGFSGIMTLLAGISFLAVKEILAGAAQAVVGGVLIGVALRRNGRFKQEYGL